MPTNARKFSCMLKKGRNMQLEQKNDCFKKQEHFFPLRLISPPIIHIIPICFWPQREICLLMSMFITFITFLGHLIFYSILIEPRFDLCLLIDSLIVCKLPLKPVQGGSSSDKRHTYILHGMPVQYIAHTVYPSLNNDNFESPVILMHLSLGGDQSNQCRHRENSTQNSPKLD